MLAPADAAQEMCLYFAGSCVQQPVMGARQAPGRLDERDFGCHAALRAGVGARSLELLKFPAWTCSLSMCGTMRCIMASRLLSSRYMASL